MERVGETTKKNVNYVKFRILYVTVVVLTCLQNFV